VAQEHLDALSGADAAFLEQERGGTHMHLGAVARFAGPPPAYGDLLACVRSRLPLVPRYRQRLVAPPAGLGRPRWVDDPSFNLEYHVRHTGVPEGASDEARRRQLGRLFAQRLDRTKPLWELWLVEERDEEGFLLVAKTHAVLVDGVLGVDLLTVLFEQDPDAPEGRADAWVPEPEPTPAQLVAPLPIGEPEPVERLRRVSDALHDVRRRRAAMGADLIAAAQDFAPPTLLAQASRLSGGGRRYNLAVTNVPGPQHRLHLLGRRMEAIWPVGFLQRDRALSIAVMSYAGGVHFGLIADPDAVPDADVLAAGVREALDELVALTTPPPRVGGRRRRG
jgi:hypothetical protein